MKKSFIILFGCCAFSAHAQFITNNGIEINNTGIVFTNGDWVNAGPIRNDGTLITTDSWTNTGTLDAASTGGFVLQYATHKTFMPGGTHFGFIVKEGAGNAEITGVFELRDSLSIKGGLLTPLTAADVLTMNETATVTSTPGSFLQGGNLVRKGTGNLFFPVGRGGNYLPITLVNVSGTSPSISVALEDAPTGYTAGAGVEALVDFPYIWRVTKTDAADTASYVEVEYPETLTPGVTNPIVVRQDGLASFKGMGARLITNADGTTTVRSYSRGLKGVFSVAKGFPGNLETDRLALEALYTATNGSVNWIGKPTWLQNDDVTTWEGVTETGGYVTSLLLPGTGVKGNVPEALADLGGLQTVDLSGNDITFLPDLSGLTGITALNVSNNRLDFGSIIPNKDIPGINYENQKELTLADTSLVEVGTTTSIDIVTGGQGNLYQWKLNDVPLAGATSATYEVAAINRSNMGNYTVEITNPAVPNTTLRSGNKRVLATATLSGKLLEDETNPITQGKVTLYRVNPLGAFEVKDVQPVQPDGTYSLEKVVLDDYILLAEADPLVYANDLPTYYKNTLYWEEADTLFLNENRADLTILSQKKPTEAPKGQGVIKGVFEDPSIQVPGRTQANKRIANAGGSVRRRTNVGKPQEEELTLIAYLFTDENGEFNFENLEQGEYLLNLQLPGYPMDPTSFINISIGTGLARNVQVQALIEDNKINVKKLVITGWDETEKRFAIFPNPATAHLSIQIIEGSSNLSYAISNAVGVQVLDGDLPFTGVADIATDTLANGTYVVQLKQEGRMVKTFRIVISH